MRTRWMLTGVVLVASILSGCTSGSDGPQASPSPPTTRPTASSSPIAGTVTVVVSGIEGERGGELAGVLFRGDGTDPDRSRRGGFSVPIDSDPFSTTQVVHHGYRGWPDASLGLPFPYVLDEVATVEPGTYTLTLFVADRVLPYSRWVPALTPSLKGCTTTLLVEEGRGAVVTLTDPVLFDAPWGRLQLMSCITT